MRSPKLVKVDGRLRVVLGEGDTDVVTTALGFINGVLCPVPSLTTCNRRKLKALG